MPQVQAQHAKVEENKNKGEGNKGPDNNDFHGKVSLGAKNGLLLRIALAPEFFPCHSQGGFQG